jgi:hypothetical protein
MRKYRTNRKRGVTLLITLIVLVILAIIIVQFQTEAMIHVRSNQFRFDRLQCRYAAESGIIVAAQMIKQAHRQPHSLQPPVEPTLEEASLEDPNLLGDIELPPLEDIESQEQLPSFVMMKKTIEIGPVQVELEIHDENAKWPLYWLVRSPFESSGTAKAEQSFRNYTRKLGVTAQTSQNVIKQSQELAQPLNLPRPPVIIQKSVSQGGRLTRQTGRLKYAERVRERLERNKHMAIFAAQWYQQLEDDPKFELFRQKLEDRPGDFADYLSMWGAFEINVNTASEDLIYFTFQSVGLTEQQAKAIVARREQKPYTNTGELQLVKGLGIGLSNTIRGLCAVKSNTYSIHVDARFGRIRSRLLGGVYFDFGDKMQLAAVFPGD